MATIKGLTVAIGADTKQFNKELRLADKSIKTTSNQVKALTDSLEIEFDGTRFNEALKLAQNVIEQTESKAQTLKKQLEYLESNGGVDTENYKKLQTELINTESKAIVLKQKLEEIKNIKLDQLSNQFKATGESITKAGQALKPISIAATAALAGFAAIGKSAIASAGDIDDLSQQINISAEDLQKWRYVAMQSGLDSSQLQNAFVKTQAALADLSTGAAGPGSEALKKLGLSSDDAAKGMGSNLNEIVQRLASIEDPIQKASLANELFGDRLGSKLIPLLNQGGQGLSKLTEEFESLGFMTNDQVKSLADFDDKLNTIKYSFEAMKNAIGVALLPIMESLATIITEKIVPAVQKFSEWFSNLSLSQQKLIFGTLAIVAALAPILILIGKMTSGIGSLISSTGGLTKALTLLSAHPIIAVILLIIALLTTLYFTNENFRTSINDLFTQLKNSLMPVLETLMGTLGVLLNSLMPMIQILGNVLGVAIKALTPIILFFVDLLIKRLVPTIEIIAFVVKTVFGFVVKVIQDYIQLIEKVINGIIDFINVLIRQINKLGDVLGFTVTELKKVELSTQINSMKPDQKVIQTSESVIASTKIEGSPSTVINNDYSDKEIVINVTVENYAKEVDTDKLIRDINLKLAEAM